MPGGNNLDVLAELPHDHNKIRRTRTPMFNNTTKQHNSEKNMLTCLYNDLIASDI